MPKLTFILFFSLLSQFALCQVNHPKSKQELIAVCDKFMDAFRKGKCTEAYDLIKPYTVIQDYQLDTLAGKSTKMMIALASTYGKAISFEQASEKPVKNTLSRVMYLLKFEKSFLRFRFILYNNESGWTITKFEYDEGIDDLF
jgi:hypothetical protein